MATNLSIDPGLLASLCIAHVLVMLSTDRDFARIAESTSLVLWDRAPRT